MKEPGVRRKHMLLEIERISPTWGLAIFADRKLKFRVHGDKVTLFGIKSGVVRLYRSPTRAMQVLRVWKSLLKTNLTRLSA